MLPRESCSECATPRLRHGQYRQIGMRHYTVFKACEKLAVQKMATVGGSETR